MATTANSVMTQLIQDGDQRLDGASRTVGTYVAEPKTAGRSLARRAERASDLGGDTGNRTPDLLLANSRLSRHLPSLSTYAAPLVGMKRG